MHGILPTVVHQEQVIAELRERMTGSDFKAAADYFFDTFVGLPELRDTRTVRHDRLDVAVRTVIAQYFDGQKPQQLLIGRLDKTPLLHGMAALDGVICAFFYFEDIDTGLVVLSPFASGGTTAFVRFSLFDVGHEARLTAGPKQRC